MKKSLLSVVSCVLVFHLVFADVWGWTKMGTDSLFFRRHPEPSRRISEEKKVSVPFFFRTLFSPLKQAIKQKQLNCIIREEYCPVDARLGSVRPLFFIVEDCHGNTQAQRNIAQLCAWLYRSYKIDMALVEGAVGPLDVNFLLVHPSSSGELMLSLLDEGYLTGLEYWAATVPEESLRCFGVEDGAAYQAHYEVLRRIVCSGKIRRFLKKYGQLIDAVVMSRTSVGLRRLLRLQYGISCHGDRLPVVQQGENLVHMVRALPDGKRDRFYRKYRSLLMFLSDVSSIDVEDVPAIMDHVPAFVRELTLAILRNDSDRWTLKQFDSYVRISEALQLRVSGNSVKEINCAPDRDAIAELFSQAGESRWLFFLERWLPAVFALIDRFYALAQQRDSSLAFNALAQAQSGISKGSILHCGGFHTFGITQILRSKDIPYVVLTPMIDLEQVGSYEGYFAHFAQGRGNLRFLSSPQACVMVPSVLSGATIHGRNRLGLLLGWLTVKAGPQCGQWLARLRASVFQGRSVAVCVFRMFVYLCTVVYVATLQTASAENLTLRARVMRSRSKARVRQALNQLLVRRGYFPREVCKLKTGQDLRWDIKTGSPIIQEEALDLAFERKDRGCLVDVVKDTTDEKIARRIIGRFSAQADIVALAQVFVYLRDLDPKLRLRYFFYRTLRDLVEHDQSVVGKFSQLEGKVRGTALEMLMWYLQKEADRDISLRSRLLAELDSQTELVPLIAAYRPSGSSANPLKEYQHILAGQGVPHSVLSIYKASCREFDRRSWIKVISLASQRSEILGNESWLRTFQEDGKLVESYLRSNHPQCIQLAEKFFPELVELVSRRRKLAAHLYLKEFPVGVSARVFLFSMQQHRIMLPDPLLNPQVDDPKIVMMSIDRMVEWGQWRMVRDMIFSDKGYPVRMYALAQWPNDVYSLWRLICTMPGSDRHMRRALTDKLCSCFMRQKDSFVINKHNYPEQMRIMLYLLDHHAGGKGRIQQFLARKFLTTYDLAVWKHTGRVPGYGPAIGAGFFRMLEEELVWRFVTFVKQQRYIKMVSHSKKALLGNPDAELLRADLELQQCHARTFPLRDFFSFSNKKAFTEWVCRYKQIHEGAYARPRPWMECLRYLLYPMLLAMGLTSVFFVLYKRGQTWLHKKGQRMLVLPGSAQVGNQHRASEVPGKDRAQLVSLAATLVNAAGHTPDAEIWLNDIARLQTVLEQCSDLPVRRVLRTDTLIALVGVLWLQYKHSGKEREAQSIRACLVTLLDVVGRDQQANGKSPRECSSGHTEEAVHIPAKEMLLRILMGGGLERRTVELLSRIYPLQNFGRTVRGIRSRLLLTKMVFVVVSSLSFAYVFVAAPFVGFFAKVLFLLLIGMLTMVDWCIYVTTMRMSEIIDKYFRLILQQIEHDRYMPPSVRSSYAGYIAAGEASRWYMISLCINVLSIFSVLLWIKPWMALLYGVVVFGACSILVKSVSGKKGVSQRQTEFLGSVSQAKRLLRIELFLRKHVSAVSLWQSVASKRFSGYMWALARSQFFVSFAARLFLPLLGFLSGDLLQCYILAGYVALLMGAGGFMKCMAEGSRYGDEINTGLAKIIASSTTILPRAWKGQEQLTEEQIAAIDSVTYKGITTTIRDNEGNPVIRDQTLVLPRGTITFCRAPNSSGKTVLAKTCGYVYQSEHMETVLQAKTFSTQVSKQWDHSQIRRLFLYTDFEHIDLEECRLGDICAACGIDGDAFRQEMLQVVSPEERELFEDTAFRDIVLENGRLSKSLRCRIKLVLTLLVHDPLVLILDEPFAGLDAANTRLVLVYLRKLIQKRNIACLVIDHASPQLVRPYVDAMLAINNGTLIDGKYARQWDVLCSLVNQHGPEALPDRDELAAFLSDTDVVRRHEEGQVSETVAGEASKAEVAEDETIMGSTKPKRKWISRVWSKVRSALGRGKQGQLGGARTQLLKVFVREQVPVRLLPYVEKHLSPAGLTRYVQWSRSRGMGFSVDSLQTFVTAPSAVEEDLLRSQSNRGAHHHLFGQDGKHVLAAA